MALKVSTKGRYALRVMIDLAEHNDGSFVTLKEIAARQEISEKYLESIVVVFSKNGYLEGHRGKGGGYRLARNPEDITVGQVLREVEGDLAPVACLGPNAAPCSRAASCKTLPMWSDFYEKVNNYFDGMTVADLAEKDNAADYYVI